MRIRLLLRIGDAVMRGLVELGESGGVGVGEYESEMNRRIVCVHTHR